MNVHVVRDRRVAPGGEGTVELPGGILFVVSADGITQDGAEALEDGWCWFISRGVWRYGERGGSELAVSYRRTVLPDDVVVQVRNGPGSVECLLSPCHFTTGSTNGLLVAARMSVRRGWRNYADPEVPATMRRAS